MNVKEDGSHGIKTWKGMDGYRRGLKLQVDPIAHGDSSNLGFELGYLIQRTP